MALPPNKIKYSTSFVANSIKANNFALGINETGAYGPTSITNFWMGITPTFNGYTAYLNKAAQGPSIYTLANDAAVINLAQYLGGSNISTINDALAWFSSQGDKICVNMNYPDIVTSGLSFNVDSGFVPSYCRSGVTWTDLSYSGFNATLINSPTFTLSGNNNGIFSFALANSNYATFNDLGTLSNFSTEVWVKQNSLPAVGSYVPAFITNTYVSGNYVNYAIGYINPAQDGKIYGGFFNSGWNYNTNGFTPTTDQWYHYAVTFNGSNIIFYVDGNYYSSGTTSSAAISSGSGGRLMRRWDDVNYIDGALLNAKIYNRALTSTEIKQNFNAHSLPLGTVTTSLVLNYDAGNVLSYPGSGSIWKNMAAPTTNNGVLTNGAAYSVFGSIVFDGVNDYVSGGTANMGLDLSSKTFQAWIRTNGQAHYGIIDKDFDTGVGVYGGWGFWINSSGKLWWWNHQNKDLIDNGALSVADATWTNVAVTYNYTTKSASFYYNGVLSSTLTDATITEISSGTQPVNIGSIRAGSAAFFKGQISQVIGYNRVLSATEILINYNASRARFI